MLAAACPAACQTEPVDQHILIFAPPRTGKTQLLGWVIAHFPGAALSTTQMITSERVGVLGAYGARKAS